MFSSQEKLDMIERVLRESKDTRNFTELDIEITKAVFTMILCKSDELAKEIEEIKKEIEEQLNTVSASCDEEDDGIIGFIGLFRNKFNQVISAFEAQPYSLLATSVMIFNAIPGNVKMYRIPRVMEKRIAKTIRKCMTTIINLPIKIQGQEVIVSAPVLPTFCFPTFPAGLKTNTYFFEPHSPLLYV